jgi:hypothetical protein
VIFYICGEHIQGDHIIYRSAGGFDGPPDFPDDISSLGASVAKSDDITFRIRCRLTGDKNHSAGLSNIDQAVTTAGSAQALRVHCNLCHCDIPPAFSARTCATAPFNQARAWLDFQIRDMPFGKNL